MAFFEPLTTAVDWWSSLQADHQVVSVTVRFLHLAGIVVGGGTALAADRQVLRARRAEAADRAAALAFVAGAHRVVVPSLALVVATGVLLTAADASVFVASRLFWLKMLLVVALVGNGAVLTRVEASARRGAPDAWRRMSVVSLVSLALWLVILLAGEWLTVAA